MYKLLCFSAVVLLGFGVASTAQGSEKILTWDAEEISSQAVSSENTSSSLGFVREYVVREAFAQNVPSKVIQDLINGISGWVCEGVGCNPHAGPWDSDIGRLSRQTNGYRIAWDGSSMVVAGDAWCSNCYAVGAKTFFIGDKDGNTPVNLSVRADAWSAYHSMVTNARVMVWAGNNNANRLILAEHAYFPRYGIYNNDYSRDLAPLLNSTDNLIKVGFGLSDSWVYNWNQRAWFSNMQIAYNYIPPTCSVDFEKTGAQGATWSITIDGSEHSGTGNTISVSDVSCTAEYEYDETIQGTSGTQYICASGCSGVIGDSETTSATYETEHQLLMQVNHPSGGTTTPSTGAYYPAGTSVQISAIPSDGWQFVRWQGNGPGHYTGQNNPSAVTVQGPITQTAVFEEIFAQAGILCAPDDITYDACEAYIFQADNPFYILDNTTTPQGVSVEERFWSFPGAEGVTDAECVQSDDAGCTKLQVSISETGTHTVELSFTDNAGRSYTEEGELLVLEISPQYREVIPQ